MQRNIATEGWYEMHPTDQALKRGHFDSQAEMNVRVHLKEDTALPYTVYSELGAVGILSSCWRRHELNLFFGRSS